MYDHLVGEVVECHAAHVVVRAGGVGYQLKVPVSTSASLAVGQSARLYTILHVVDGTPTLLAFTDRRERDLAKRLMTVSGVGPAMSLAILSTFTAAQVARMIVDGEAATLRRVKGVGQKTAERLCLELRDHLAMLIEPGEPGLSERGQAIVPQSAEDAVAALLTLGYSERDARTKVQRVHRDEPDADTEHLIKAVLRG